MAKKQTPTFTFRDVSVPDDDSNFTSLAFLVEPSDVQLQAGWDRNLKNELLVAVNQAVGSTVEITNLSVIDHGSIKVIELQLRGVVADTIAEMPRVVKACIKKLAVPAPVLNFEVKTVTTSFHDGKVTTVFHDGPVDTAYVTLPVCNPSVTMAYNRANQVVIITGANPLFAVTDEDIAAVQAALQAGSVNPS